MRLCFTSKWELEVEVNCRHMVVEEICRNTRVLQRVLVVAVTCRRNEDVIM